jgi:hypothetical protein
MLRPDQWQLVAAIAGGRTVADVLDTRGLAEFDGCRAVKELVDLRLVRVVAPAPEPVPEPAADLVPETVEDLVSEPVSEPVPEPVPEPVRELEPTEAHAPDLSDDLMGPEEWGGADVPEVADLSEIWDDETGDVIRTSDVQSGSDEHGAAGPEPEVAVPDPVNRGLLLKFLGSARN